MALNLNILGLVTLTTGQQASAPTTPSISFVSVTGVVPPSPTALGPTGVGTISIPGLLVGDLMVSCVSTDPAGNVHYAGPMGGTGGDISGFFSGVVTTADELGWTEPGYMPPVLGIGGQVEVDYSGWTASLTFLRSTT